jgi:hypothetical protein
MCCLDITIITLSHLSDLIYMKSYESEIYILHMLDMVAPRTSRGHKEPPAKRALNLFVVLSEHPYFVVPSVRRYIRLW